MHRIYFCVEDCLSQMVTSLCFFLFCVVDIVAGVGDSVDNGPDAVSVVFGSDFISTE